MPIQGRRLRSSLIAALVVFATPLAFAANPVQVENAKLGTADYDAWPEAAGEIEGYASATSVNRGESINIYVNTTESTYMIEIFRMGWYGGDGARRMLGPVGRSGRVQPGCPMDAQGRVECNWTDPYILTIPNSADPTDWMSGAYLVRLTAGTSGKKKYVYFVVRDDARRADHYFQSSVTTFQAYNNWGGKSVYSFNSCTDWKGACTTMQPQAAKVSFNRPYSNGGGSGQFLWSWEYNMIRFLEREGYDVVYGTNIDTHRRAAQLLNYRSFLSVGHDEYWTWEMRQNVTAARNAGVHLGFFSANTCYWQIRLENNDRTIVAYRSKYAQDPLYTNGNPADDYLVTTTWRDPLINRPESALIGVQYYYDESRLAVDMVLDDVTSAPWVFAGTGAVKGTKITGVLGYEIDSMDANSPSNTIRLAHSPYQNNKVSPPATQYSNMTVYTAPSGALVFATGTIQWSWAIDSYGDNRHPTTPVSAVAQQITRNVLWKFAPDCQWSITPANVTVAAAAGSGSVAITSANPSCSWSATSSASWLTITQGASGSSNGTLRYAFTANGGPARSATITIGDKTFVVTQTPTVPPAATLVSPAGTVSTTRPTFTWNKVAEATWYYLWVDTTGGTNITKTWYEAAAVCGASTCSVVLPASLTDVTSYNWWIQTWNGGGYGPWSASQSFSVVTSAPPAATLISPSGTISGSTSPTYTWNKVGNATWYYFTLRTASGTAVSETWFDAAAVCGTSTCSATPSVTITPGTNYTWWIHTWNPAGYGPLSAGSNFVLGGAGGPPGPPTLVSPSGTVSTLTPAYTWNAVTGATSYYLWVSGPSGPVVQTTYSSSTICNSTSCSVTPAVTLTAGASHTWWVAASNSAGTGAWSAAMTFTPTTSSGPAAATLLSPTGTQSSRTPRYRWSAVNGVTWYSLKVQQSSGSPVIEQWYRAEEVCTGSTCEAAPATTLNVGTYAWSVQTYNATGYGPWSTAMQFSVQDGPPGPPTLVSPSGTVSTLTPTYTWSAVSGATSYNLWVNNPSGPVVQTTYSSSAICSSTSCSVTPAVTLTAGASHTWWVAASNSAGTGAWSAAMTFTPTTSSGPAAATLLSPTGTQSTRTPRYRWSAVSGVTWYNLKVQQSSGSPVIEQWYRTEEVCTASTCEVAPATALNPGTYTWSVQTYNASGYGAWSAAMQFSVP